MVTQEFTVFRWKISLHSAYILVSAVEEKGNVSSKKKMERTGSSESEWVKQDETYSPEPSAFMMMEIVMVTIFPVLYLLK